MGSRQNGPSAMEVNAFLVGASKCGTSTLVDLMSVHEEISVCGIKEPNYFSDDLPEDVFSRRHAKNVEQYHDLWAGGNEKTVVKIEASVGYFYSKVAAMKIKEYNPSSKIIIILRNPVDRLRSAHGHRLNSGNEDVSGVLEALSLDSKRKTGASLPRGCANFRPYREMMDYPKQIKRFLECFDREMVHIMLMEDLIEERERSICDLWDFLEVKDIGTYEVPHSNKSNIVRSRMASSLMAPNSFLVRFFYVPLRKFRVFSWLGRKIRELNLKEGSPPKLSESERIFLASEFREMAEETSRITGIDVMSRWSDFH